MNNLKEQKKYDYYTYTNLLIVLATLFYISKLFIEYSNSFILVPVLLSGLFFLLINLLLKNLYVSFYIKLICSTLIIGFLMYFYLCIADLSYINYSVKIYEGFIIGILIIFNYLSLYIECAHFNINPIKVVSIEGTTANYELGFLIMILLSVVYLYLFFYISMLLFWGV